MYGSGEEYLTNLRKRDLTPDIYQTKIKAKNESLINNNQIKTLKTKNQSADYLIEYFEGMILNYISIAKEKDKRLDELKNLILNHKRKDRFKGGKNSYLDNNSEYKNYTNDATKTNIDITLFDKNDNNWGYIDIEIHVDYQKEYYMCIKHENNGFNIIDLIIDLQHNAIIDKVNRLRNDDISTNTKNITYILETITPILMKYNHDDSTLVSLNFYDSAKTTYITDSLNIDGSFIRSIISLLIMILTLKNNVSKDVYKKYNTTFLLSGICKYYLLENLLATNYKYSLEIFSCNNRHLLTYSQGNHIITQDGDCALNSLICIKNEDIRKLFIDKISYGQKNKKMNIHEVNKYIIDINNVLGQMENYQLNGFNLISSIRNYINEYGDFIYSFTSNDYSLFKNAILNNNYTTLPIEYKEYFTKLYNRYLKFAHVLRNNLLDYNLNDNEADEMCDDITDDLIEVNNLLQSEVQSGNYDYTSGAQKFITIIDRHLKYKDSFGIFYINLLISLLLIQHKIDYLFDEDIINVLRYSDKINIIKCFRNIEHNRNELSVIIPIYQQGYENDKYIFKYTSLLGVAHAVIYVIDVSTPTKKIYLYDMNYLDMCYCEDFNPNNYRESLVYHPGYYTFDDNPRRWIKNKMNIEKYYNSDIITWIFKFDRINDFNGFSYFREAIIDSLSLHKNPVFRNDGYLDFVKLLTLNDAEYNKNNFNYEYYIKKQIFNILVNFATDYIKNQKVDINFLNIVNYITNFIQNNIINEESCDIRKTLFKFIECLIKAEWISAGKNVNTINLDNEYKKIRSFFDDTYYIGDTDVFVKGYLDFEDSHYCHLMYNHNIIYTLNTLIFKINREYIVYGGYLNTNSNNSILKRVLIILLIIVIIIIIVLIVLFIINKYKNNKSDP